MRSRIIDGHEDKGWPLGDGHRGRHVRTPQHVGRLSDEVPSCAFGP